MVAQILLLALSTIFSIGIFYLLYKIFVLHSNSKYKETITEIQDSLDSIEKQLINSNIHFQENNINIAKIPNDQNSKDDNHNQSYKIKSNKRNLNNRLLYDDNNLNKLVTAYETLTSENSFLPFSQIYDALLQQKFVESKNEAHKLISELSIKYPRSIRIEDVRGSKEKHIAIYKELI